MGCWPTDALSTAGFGLIIVSAVMGEIVTAVNQGRRLFLRYIWPFSDMRDVLCGLVTRERRRRNRLRSQSRVVVDDTPYT